MITFGMYSVSYSDFYLFRERKLCKGEKIRRRESLRLILLVLLLPNLFN